MPVNRNPDSKVHGGNMGPTWVLSAPHKGNTGTIASLEKKASF